MPPSSHLLSAHSTASIRFSNLFLSLESKPHPLFSTFLEFPQFFNHYPILFHRVPFSSLVAVSRTRIQTFVVISLFLSISLASKNLECYTRLFSRRNRFSSSSSPPRRQDACRSNTSGQKTPSPTTLAYFFVLLLRFFSTRLPPRVMKNNSCLHADRNDCSSYSTSDAY